MFLNNSKTTILDMNKTSISIVCFDVHKDLYNCRPNLRYMELNED